MTVTLELQPEIERSILARAAARGQSIIDFLQDVVAQEASAAVQAPASHGRTGQDLIDASAKVRGLFTDEEVDTLFQRNSSSSRPIDFE